MAQIVIWGHRTALDARRDGLSDAVHGAVMAALDYPEEKRFHRFLLLDADDLVAPRSAEYLVIEIVCFTGRSEHARRALLAALFEAGRTLGLSPDDLEIVILESPPQNWGIRGVAGDQLTLDYVVDV